MSFCFSLLNRVNFYGHLFPLLISIHLSVSRAHALEEHKTRGHQTGAGQGKQELPVLSMRVKHAHTSVAFPEPLPGRFALGMAQTGFVTFRASRGQHQAPLCCCVELGTKRCWQGCGSAHCSGISRDSQAGCGLHGDHSPGPCPPSPAFPPIQPCKAVCQASQYKSINICALSITLLHPQGQI